MPTEILSNLGVFEDKRKGPSEPEDGHSMMNDGDLAAVPIGVIHEEFVFQRIFHFFPGNKDIVYLFNLPGRLRCSKCKNR